MVTQWGMSDKLGPLHYEENQDEVFLGHSVSRQQNVSEQTAEQIDARDPAHRRGALRRRATQVLTENIDELHALAGGAARIRDAVGRRDRAIFWPASRSCAGRGRIGSRRRRRARAPRCRPPKARAATSPGGASARASARQLTTAPCPSSRCRACREQLATATSDLSSSRCRTRPATDGRCGRRMRSRARRPGFSRVEVLIRHVDAVERGRASTAGEVAAWAATLPETMAQRIVALLRASSAPRPPVAGLALDAAADHGHRQRHARQLLRRRRCA